MKPKKKPSAALPALFVYTIQFNNKNIVVLARRLSEAHSHFQRYLKKNKVAAISTPITISFGATVDVHDNLKRFTA